MSNKLSKNIFLGMVFLLRIISVAYSIIPYEDADNDGKIGDVDKCPNSNLSMGGVNEDGCNCKDLNQVCNITQTASAGASREIGSTDDTTSNGERKCTDRAISGNGEDGDNEFIAGITKIIGKRGRVIYTRRDVCRKDSNWKVLKEYSCNVNNKIRFRIVDCEFGCEGRKCNNASDGNVFEKSKTQDNSNSGDKNTKTGEKVSDFTSCKDSEIKKVPYPELYGYVWGITASGQQVKVEDKCSGGKAVDEAYCENGAVNHIVVPCKSLPDWEVKALKAEYHCVKGECRLGDNQKSGIEYVNEDKSKLLEPIGKVEKDSLAVTVLYFNTSDSLAIVNKGLLTVVGPPDMKVQILPAIKPYEWWEKKSWVSQTSPDVINAVIGQTASDTTYQGDINTLMGYNPDCQNPRGCGHYTALLPANYYMVLFEMGESRVYGVEVYVRDTLYIYKKNIVINVAGFGSPADYPSTNGQVSQVIGPDKLTPDMNPVIISYAELINLKEQVLNIFKSINAAQWLEALKGKY